MDEETYMKALHDWFAWTMLEAFETLPKVLSDPEEARKEMQRLKYQSDAQLQETFRQAEKQVVTR